MLPGDSSVSIPPIGRMHKDAFGYRKRRKVLADFIPTGFPREAAALTPFLACRVRNASRRGRRPCRE